MIYKEMCTICVVFPLFSQTFYMEAICTPVPEALYAQEYEAGNNLHWNITP
jgi:hypothetical protein